MAISGVIASALDFAADHGRVVAAIRYRLRIVF
jgi:hypothetical protein